MESCELQNDYPLAPDKIVIKEKMLSKYQLLTADFYNILIGHAKKLVSNFFDKENKSASKWKLGLKLKNTSPIRIQSITMVKTIYWIKHTIKNRRRKQWTQRWKSASQTNEQCYIRKNNAKVVNKEKDYLKCISKPSYTSSKIFDNNLVLIGKSKLKLILNKPAYIELCILDLSKILMHKFHYDYVKNEYGHKSRLLFTETDC